jgi:dTMP kinase
MSQTKFISIEGGEGAGKSTVMQFVQSHLKQAGISSVLTREPGGTKLAEQIRGLLLHTDVNEKVEPATELLLMFAARAQHLQQFILPKLATGEWVVSDRFIDASYAYQAGGRNLDIGFIEALDKYVVGHAYPDLTLLLDLPPEIGFERAAKRGNGRDRIEQEKIDFFKRVRDVYLQRAQKDPARIKIIDASRSVQAVEEQVAAALNQLMTSAVS